MKTWLKVLIGIAGAIGLFIGAIFYFTSGVARIGDQFVEAVGAGNMEAAYQTLSRDFRSGTSEAALAAYLASSGMEKLTGASWNNRSVSSGRGRLSGTVTTPEGNGIPVEIDLVQEEGDWRIFSIRTVFPRPGLATGPRDLPGEPEQVALVAESMHVVVDALAARDMTGLHNHIARLWARQIDVAGLDRAFSGLYEAGEAMQVIKRWTPAFTEPVRLSEGVMEIKGHYPTRPEVQFELRYIYEGTGWKLLGVHANVY